MGASTDVSAHWLVTPRGTAALWGGILAGPVAWILDDMSSYALVQWSCGSGHIGVLRLVTLGALVIVAVGAALAFTAFRSTSNGFSAEGSTPYDRSRYMALLGMVMCAFFALVIIANAVPRWLLDPCIA